MDQNNCRETIFDDIVRVDVYPVSQCRTTIPRVVGLMSIDGANLFTGNPSLSMTLNSDAMQMQTVPTLKVSNARQAAGNIYTHDLQATVNLSRQEAQNAVDALQGVDFHIIYTHADGARSLGFSLPNTATIDIDESLSSGATITVKAKLLSYSGLVPIL